MENLSKLDRLKLEIEKKQQLIEKNKADIKKITFKKKQILAKEQIKTRKERARQLIEIGAFLTAGHHEIVHQKMKANEPTAIKLQAYLIEAFKKHGWIV
jgi:hypothetical protein